MNKKIIVFILGLILILIGLLGWNCFNRENNLDNQVLEDITEQERAEQEPEVTEPEPDLNQEETLNTTNEENRTKTAKARTLTKRLIINTPEPSVEVTPVLSEKVTQEKTLEDPYVDKDGSIVVVNEFRPTLKQKIFYRGVVYDIKTK